jgi:quercetin dioxygenase-like cupin family protein
VVQVGEIMENPASGERFVWRATAASTGGEYCEFDLFLAPGARIAAAHRHPSQLETFSVLSGTLEMHIGGRQRVVPTGEEAAVPAATEHALGNPSDEPAHVVCRITPSYLIDEFFEAFCGIANRGELNKAGLPRNPLQFAVLADYHRAELQLPSPLAQALLGPTSRVLAVIGRAAGFRPDGTRAARAR